MTDLAPRSPARAPRGWSLLPVAMAGLVALLLIGLLSAVVPGPVIALTSVVVVAVLGRILWRQRQRLAEEGMERDALADHVRRGDERLDALIRDTTDVVTMLAPDGTIAYDSPALERALGYAAASRLGTPLEAYLHPDDVTALREALAAVTLRPWATDTTELRVRHQDGTWRDVHLALRNGIAELAIGALIVTSHDVTERRRADARLAYDALHDPLTGLANRRQFTDHVSQAMRRQPHDGTVAVLVLDIDDFRSINDALGHGIGDRSLISVAERVVEAARGAESVARLGADEFGILISCATDDGVPESIAAQVLAAIRRPTSIDGHHIPNRGSIGIALARQGQTVEQLVAAADMAMRLAKQDGGDRFVRSDDVGSGEAMSQLSMRLDLLGALQRDELHLEYQPIVDLVSGRVVLAEALLRWTHPTNGPIPPAVFVELAETSGVIVDIGRWAVREACVGASALRSAGLQVGVSVNVSGRQLRDSTFPLAVTQALAYAELSPERLVLEITESVLVKEAEVGIAFLRRLRERGVRVAIDDFGTGYSSLDYLRRFSVDILKIDRAFVQGGVAPGQGARDGADGSHQDLLSMIVDLALRLGITIIAEGIERPAELDRLRRLKAHYGQGYLFAPAMPLERLIEFVRERPVQDEAEPIILPASRTSETVSPATVSH